MAPDTYSGVVMAAVAVLSLLGSCIGVCWYSFRRFCARLDGTDDRLATLERVMRRVEVALQIPGEGR